MCNLETNTVYVTHRQIAEDLARRGIDSAIADDLARLGVESIICSEDCGVLIQTIVTSALAARMLAPMKRKAAGQFRPLGRDLVEIDAIMAHAMAARVLTARSQAMAESAAKQLH